MPDVRLLPEPFCCVTVAHGRGGSSASIAGGELLVAVDPVSRSLPPGGVGWTPADTKEQADSTYCSSAGGSDHRVPGRLTHLAQQRAVVSLVRCHPRMSRIASLVRPSDGGSAMRAQQGLPHRVPGATVTEDWRTRERHRRYRAPATLGGSRCWADDDAAILRLREGLRRWDPRMPHPGEHIHLSN
jgi:hypothetical protein